MQQTGMWRIRMIGQMVIVADGVLRFGAYPNNDNALTLSIPIDSKLT